MPCVSNSNLPYDEEGPINSENDKASTDSLKMTALG